MSMAAHGARRLARMNQNLSSILGVELLCAARGVEFRSPLQTSQPLRQVIASLREQVPTLEDDRYLAPDIAIAGKLIGSGEIVGAAQSPTLNALGEL